MNLTTRIRMAIALSGMLLCVQCKKQEEQQPKEKEPSYDETYEPIYINQFRLTYFWRMLVKSYNNPAAVREMLRQDHSGFTEPILTLDDSRYLDSLVSKDYQAIQADSAASIGHVAEGAEGKHALQFIMDRLSENWLDSLAAERYKLAGKGY